MARYMIVLGLGRAPEYAATKREARVIRDLRAGDRIIDTKTGERVR
jgi:hypothetical protein